MICRTFKSRKTEIEAFRGVDLSVGTGEIFGFLGQWGRQDRHPSNAGDAADAHVRRGDDRRGRPRGAEPQAVRERIGYVPQGGSTDPAEGGRGELVVEVSCTG